jgi:hypothetical protein
MRRFFQRRTQRVVDAVICSTALMCQVAILAFARCGASAYAILLAHAAVVAGLSYCLLARRRLKGDGTVLTIALVATASTGPIGAIGCAVLAWLRVLVNPYRLAHRGWLVRPASADTDDPAALLAARIKSGRSIDPSAPVPSSLESALTGGRPADRAAAFYRLSARYDPELAGVLNAALTSATLPVRTPAYAILASLIESALARTAVVARLPVTSGPEADRALAEAEAILRRCPFDIIDTSIGEMVAGRVHALCMSILRQHPQHGGALLVASRALVTLRRFEEADRLLRDLAAHNGAHASEVRPEWPEQPERFSDIGERAEPGLGRGT